MLATGIRTPDTPGAGPASTSTEAVDVIHVRTGDRDRLALL